MRRIISLLVVAGSLGCASARPLPSVGARAGPPTSAEAESKRELPDEPKAQWRLAPSGQGVALELRF